MVSVESLHVHRKTQKKANKLDLQTDPLGPLMLPKHVLLGISRMSPGVPSRRRPSVRTTSKSVSLFMLAVFEREHCFLDDNRRESKPPFVRPDTESHPFVETPPIRNGD